MKRALDVLISVLGLLLSCPVLLLAKFAIWLQDRHSPFYIAMRVGRNGAHFRMVKLRSMVVAADKSGVDSTSGDDPRITLVGRFIRRSKLDELPQLWNVLLGEMSLVGPRPNVDRDVALYTDVERRLLSVRPGITDISSIVFADEGEILRGSADPDLEYNQRIRPWKSRLGLLYIDHLSLWLDIGLLWLTVVSSLSRCRALEGVNRVLVRKGADEMLRTVALRQDPPSPYPPPGDTEVATRR